MVLWPAWPPRATRSSTTVSRPSDDPYTAAASPAGPAPTISRSHSSDDGLLRTPSARDLPVGRVFEDAAAEDDGHRQPRGALEAGVPKHLPALRGRRVVETEGDSVTSEHVAQFVRAGRPRFTDQPHRLVHRALQTGPPIQESRHLPVEPLVRRRVPGLGDEELDLAHGAADQDRLRGAAVAPGDEHDPLGDRVDTAGCPEKVGPFHLRHVLVGEDEGHRLPGVLEAAELVERRRRGLAAEHTVVAPVALAELLLRDGQPDHVVVDDEDHRLLAHLLTRVDHIRGWCPERVVSSMMSAVGLTTS